VLTVTTLNLSVGSLEKAPFYSFEAKADTWKEFMTDRQDDVPLLVMFTMTESCIHNSDSFVTLVRIVWSPPEFLSRAQSAWLLPRAGGHNPWQDWIVWKSPPSHSFAHRFLSYRPHNIPGVATKEWVGSPPCSERPQRSDDWRITRRTEGEVGRKGSC
jgi:hypothetical protein